MKKSVVPAIAGMCGVFMFANPAPADFVMLTVELFANNWDTADAEFPGNLEGIRDVWRVYAHFNDPNDRMTSIGVALDGTAMTVENVLLDRTPGTGLYEALFGGAGDGGGPIANTAAGWGFNPTGLTFDTFLTIGNVAGYTPVIDNKQDPPAPFIFGWAPSPNPDWGDIPPNWVIDNGAIFTTPSAPYGAPVDGRVLVGQFNVADGEHIQGFANIQWGVVGGGGGGFVTQVFFTSIPTPGALALLGLAGLAGVRRRRS
ncbi:MAG: hypothetical protein IH830_12990 [Planctomycetes bacterium]|nr:hypothetical protein [Planctomycetota bacterium]